MTDLTMRWHARDDGLMHYGYDADLPGGARVYVDGDRWRCTTIVNAMDIADVDLCSTADVPIDKVLAYASDAVSRALVARLDVK